MKTFLTVAMMAFSGSSIAYSEKYHEKCGEYVNINYPQVTVKQFEGMVLQCESIMENKDKEAARKASDQGIVEITERVKRFGKAVDEFIAATPELQKKCENEIKTDADVEVMRACLRGQ